jgi:hypothetical protein
MHKTIALSAAAKKIPGGASVVIGGFLGVGIPHRIIAELVRQGRKSLTVIANDTAQPRLGIGLSLPRRRCAKSSCRILAPTRKPSSSVSVFLPCDVREPGRLESSPRIRQKLITGETVYVDAGYHNVG